MVVINIDHKSGIYQFINLVNGKSYIGKTVDLRHRYNEHMNFLRKGCDPCVKLNKAWVKYGEENFEYRVLCHCDRDQLNEMERKYIAEYDSFKHGYNCTEGGDGMQGFHHSEESKIKIGDFFRGKKLSEEHRRKLSEAQKGKPASEAKLRVLKAIWTDEYKAEFIRKRSGELNPNYGKTGKDACRKSPVVASTGEFFFTAFEATKWCGLKSFGNLCACARGERKYCGKHPVTGEKLSWRKATDEEIEKQISKCA